MYQALYRKYRPQTFSELCGQEHISATLKSQIADKRPSHAYLFTGSRGTGKTSSAKIFAKAVNCLNNVDGDPCNECEICKGIDSGAIMDVVEIDAASNNGVDNIRDLRDKIEYAPSTAKYRVYIIDEVHMLSGGAFNALLKTLEEPPEHAIFILATTEIHKIPATILSRCQRYDFNRISADVIAKRIKYVCEKENFKCDDNAAMLIAKLADGGMRDALSMLDLCAGSGGEITEKSVAECAGLVDKQYLFRLADMIEGCDAAGVLAELDRLYSSSCDMERLASELIAHYRDLMVAKTSKDYARLITATKEELDQIAAQSKKIKFEHILYAVSKLSDCTESMKRGSPKRIAMETALIRLCTPSLDSSAESLTKRISALEERLQSVAVNGAYSPAAVSPSENTPPAAPRTSNTRPASDTHKAEEIRQADSGVKDAAPSPAAPTKHTAAMPSGNAVPFDKWPEVMARLQAASPLIHAVMNNSSAYIDGDILLIDAPNSQFIDLIKGDSRHKDAIRAAAMAVTGVKYRLGPYKKSSAPKSEKSADPLDEFLKKAGDGVDVE